MKNLAQRRPEDMSCELNLKSEIKEYASRMIARGPMQGNTMMSSQRFVNRAAKIEKQR